MVEFSRIAAGIARRAAERAAVELANDHRVQLVYLFGSTADEQRPTVGDVDIAVLSEPKLTLAELLRWRADLTTAMGVEMDLISLNDAPIVLAHEIAESGRCLFARTTEAETGFVTRAHSRYWDFKPFLEEQWRLTGERVEARRRGSTT